jgi:hypothetical protein
VLAPTAHLSRLTQCHGAVLKLLQPNYSLQNPWFKRGTVLRHVLEVLRAAGTPLTPREMTERMLLARGVTDPDPAEVAKLTKSVLSALQSHKGTSLVAHAQEPHLPGRLVGARPGGSCAPPWPLHVGSRCFIGPKQAQVRVRSWRPRSRPARRRLLRRHRTELHDTALTMGRRASASSRSRSVICAMMIGDDDVLDPGRVERRRLHRADQRALLEHQRAPMASPIGAWMRAMSVSVRSCCLSRSTRRAGVFFEPSAPI